MIIKILGTGCPNCVRLENTTKQAIKELDLNIEVEKITDIEKIMSYGIMSTPALVLNEKVLCSGRIPDTEEIKNLITEEIKEFGKNIGGVCSNNTTC